MFVATAAVCTAGAREWIIADARPLFPDDRRVIMVESGGAVD